MSPATAPDPFHVPTEPVGVKNSDHPCDLPLRWSSPPVRSALSDLSGASGIRPPNRRVDEI
jgi:hypothetical protein